VLSDILDNLGDAHVGMNATFGGEPAAFRTGRGPTLNRVSTLALKAGRPAAELRDRWLADYREDVRNAVLHGRWQEASDGKVVWGHIEHDVG
jgi:hypothetical protein